MSWPQATRPRWIVAPSVAAATLAASLASATAPAVAAAPKPAAAPATAPVVTAMYVEVYLKGERRDAKVAGRLTDHDATSITLQTSADARRLAWEELTPSSAFTLKSRLINAANAGDWIALGRWGWERGLEQPARTAFARATKLDPALARSVSEITATASGSALNRPATPEPAAAAATTKPIPAPTEGDAVAGRRTNGRGGKLIRYAPSTPEEDAASIAQSRSRCAEVERLLKVKLAEVETAHFLIYTDWNPAEFGFLKTECENAYRIVARQFDRPAKENVFVGKLPIYMFAKQESFRRFAEEIDDHPVPETVLGYFVPVDEMGHMAMWKPTVGAAAANGINAAATLADGQRRWGRTLVHEFAHAFVHRYRTNVWVPRWLNEGLAEVIAESVLPTNNYYELARVAAQENVDVQPLFDDSNMPTGEAYPVMMTMVECLARRDKSKFLPFFNDIKDGTDPNDALLKAYGMDTTGLAESWRLYARALR